MDENIKQTPISFGSQLGKIPVPLWGGSTLGFAALNFPQNTTTVGVGTPAATPVEYPHSRTNVTPSGHVVQLNDTPAGERVLVKHRTGSAVDMLPDGSMAISSNGKMIFTVRSDMSLVVHGDVSWAVDGDFSLDVKGNFNVKALNIDTKAEGNIVTTALGGSIDVNAGANIREIVKGSKSTTALASITNFALGDVNTISQGGQKVISQGQMQIAGGAGSKITAQGSMDISSPSVNIAANSMTVVGATGTIGGAGIMMYADNVHAQGSVLAQSMQATTFYGDLVGTAADALQAAVAGGLAGVSIGVLTAAGVDNSGTALPNGALITDYLTLSSKGIVQVNVDADGEIRNAIDRSVFNGGISHNVMSTKDVRSALRDEANLNNSEFINNNIGAGALSPTYASYTPPGVSRAVPEEASTYLGNPDMGVSYTPSWIKPGPKPTRRSFLPDFQHYITPTTIVTENTTLLDGIKLSTFLREL